MPFNMLVFKDVTVLHKADTVECMTDVPSNRLLASIYTYIQLQRFIKSVGITQFNLK